MPNKDEKARRKELLHSHRNEERKKTQAGFPAPILALKGLFDFLDVQLADTACDHTLRFSRQYLQRNVTNEEAVVRWLEEHGGYCDCEALNNVEETVADAVRGYDQIHEGTGRVN